MQYISLNPEGTAQGMKAYILSSVLHLVNCHYCSELAYTTKFYKVHVENWNHDTQRQAFCQQMTRAHVPN